MTTVFIDTDLGDDVDDALALGLALRTKSLEVKGITTVYGEVEIRARLAAKILQTAGRTGIPVAPGARDPLKHRPVRNGWIHEQARVLGEETYSGIIAASPAHEFLANQIGASEKPVTLLAIGPQTNIAKLLTGFPEVKEQVEEIVIMGGFFSKARTEWNMSLDPEAAQIVFGSGVPMRVVPFDITQHSILDRGHLERLSKDTRPLPGLLHQLIVHWRDHSERFEPVLHDPLAVGCLLRPELYTFEGFDVRVELGEDGPYGRTVGIANKKSHIKLCTAVDYGAFLDFYTGLLLDEPVLEEAEVFNAES